MFVGDGSLMFEVGNFKVWALMAVDGVGGATTERGNSIVAKMSLTEENNNYDKKFHDVLE